MSSPAGIFDEARVCERAGAQLALEAGRVPRRLHRLDDAPDDELTFRQTPQGFKQRPREYKTYPSVQVGQLKAKMKEEMHGDVSVTAVSLTAFPTTGSKQHVEVMLAILPSLKLKIKTIEKVSLNLMLTLHHY